MHFFRNLSSAHVSVYSYTYMLIFDCQCIDSSLHNDVLWPLWFLMSVMVKHACLCLYEFVFVVNFSLFWLSLTYGIRMRLFLSFTFYTNHFDPNILMDIFMRITHPNLSNDSRFSGNHSTLIEFIHFNSAWIIYINKCIERTHFESIHLMT